MDSGSYRSELSALEPVAVSVSVAAVVAVVAVADVVVGVFAGSAQYYHF